MASCKTLLEELNQKHVRYSSFSGIPAALDELNQHTVGENIYFITIGRVILIETLLVLAVKMSNDAGKLAGDAKEKSLNRARQMIRDQVGAVNNGTDGIDESMFFTSLYSHAKQVLGWRLVWHSEK